MRILVYGAGVLGCELAHVLMQNKKNVVTLLARGEWKEMIDQKGLVIRHWVQRKTTTERIKTVDTLAPDDYYDLVFVVVQAGQLPDVLPVLKANKSQYFVFVGNNPQAKQVLEFMQRPADKIAFGFQGTAGRREHDHVVSVYASAGMTVGGATTPLSGTFRTRLKTAFDGAKYKLTFYGDMDEWLKCHIAFVLPACYVCYACNGDLHRATKQQRGAILDAAYEACLMLKDAGIPVNDANNTDNFQPGISAICAAAKNWPLPCRTSGINETQTKRHCRTQNRSGSAFASFLFYFAAFRFCCRLSHEGISLRSFSHMGIAVPVCLRRASNASSRYFISDTACMA